MHFAPRFNSVLMTMAVGLSRASPVALDLTKMGGPDPDLLVQEGIRLAQSRDIEKRLSEDFSLDHEWHNEILFGGSYTDKAPDTNLGFNLEVTCIECYTSGMVTANLWEDLFDPKLRLEFTDVEAYAFLGVETTAGQTFSINLFTSETPIGLAFPGLSVGVVFFVDLVFSLTEEIDLTGGFHVKLANDAYLEADIFGGDISDSFFDGVSTKSLPVTVHSGRATFKADLRLRVQAGAETEFDMIGIGAGAVVGVYANIIELVAVIEYTPACPLQTELWWNLNVGAFAQLDVVVDYSTIGPVPTISTTLLEAPTLTHCWIGGGASGSPGVSSSSSSSPAITATTTTSTVPSSSPSGPPKISSTSPTSSPLESGSSSQNLPYTSFPAMTPPPFPGNSTSSSAPSYPTATPTLDDDGDDKDLVTSTLYNTATHTLTRCAAPGAINCPTSYQQEIVVTRTIDAYTTVCPASASITAPPLPVTNTATYVPSVAEQMKNKEKEEGEAEVITLTRPPTPIIETFVFTQPTVTATATVVPFKEEAVALPNKETKEGEEEEEEYHHHPWRNGTSSSLPPSAYPTGTGALPSMLTATSAPPVPVSGASSVRGAARWLVPVATAAAFFALSSNTIGLF